VFLCHCQTEVYHHNYKPKLNKKSLTSRYHGSVCTSVRLHCTSS